MDPDIAWIAEVCDHFAEHMRGDGETVRTSGFLMICAGDAQIVSSAVPALGLGNGEEHDRKVDDIVAPFTLPLSKVPMGGPTRKALWAAPRVTASARVMSTSKQTCIHLQGAL